MKSKLLMLLSFLLFLFNTSSALFNSVNNSSFFKKAYIFHNRFCHSSYNYYILHTLYYYVISLHYKQNLPHDYSCNIKYLLMVLAQAFDLFFSQYIFIFHLLIPLLNSLSHKSNILLFSTPRLYSRKYRSRSARSIISLTSQIGLYIYSKTNCLYFLFRRNLSKKKSIST